MHGFFINTSLYNRVRAVAKPFEYEDYRKKKIKEKLEEKQKSRIAPKSTKQKKRLVNADLAKELEFKAGKKTKTSKVAQNMLEDNRFSNLFENPDFQIDEENINFILRNPSGKAKIRADEDMDSDSESRSEDNGFTKVDEEEEDWGGAGDDSGDDASVDYDDEENSSDDEVALAKVSKFILFYISYIEFLVSSSTSYLMNILIQWNRFVVKTTPKSMPSIRNPKSRQNHPLRGKGNLNPVYTKPMTTTIIPIPPFALDLEIPQRAEKRENEQMKYLCPWKSVSSFKMSRVQ